MVIKVLAFSEVITGKKFNNYKIYPKVWDKISLGPKLKILRLISRLM